MALNDLMPIIILGLFNAPDILGKYKVAIQISSTIGISLGAINKIIQPRIVKSFWENETPAPLPRREFSKRKDYNVLIRNNRHEITDYGWFHGQNNEKVDKINNTEKESLAFEVGYNYYKRVEDEKCKYAKDWWIENEKKWAIVRNIWNEIYSQNKDLSLKSNLDGKRLYEYLLFTNDYNDYSEIKELIISFVDK